MVYYIFFIDQFVRLCIFGRGFGGGRFALGDTDRANRYRRANGSLHDKNQPRQLHR